MAAVQPGVGRWTWGELRARATDLAGRLTAAGVGPGDRVGLCAPKSLASLGALHGVLSAGAAYVPVDAGAPADRNGAILGDTDVAALVVDTSRRQALLEQLGPGWDELATLDGDLCLLRRTVETAPGPADLAYVLATSGSTGRPKGVPLTHANALSFVRWCAETFAVGPDDRFSSHAPFHFDLSVLDLYLSAWAGGALVLVDEATGRQPRALAPLIAEQCLTVWYSTPSVLSLLVRDGKLERHDHGALRWVFFAGEVFPVPHLRALTQAWPGARFVNLYGPTETNVCTWHEVALPVPSERAEPYPIGQPCSHVRAAVLDDDGRPLPDEARGELCIAGAPVLDGYWNLPEQTAAAFHEGQDGTRWYRTGDLVDRGPDGFSYRGRRDRMVKRRGFRVELGEVEARLHRHPDLAAAAVLAADDPEQGVRLTAFCAWRDDARPSLIALKRFCAEELPGSMVPDAFQHLEALPTTSTDKIDYQRLRSLL